MKNESNEQQTTSILHRPISNRAMEIILVLTLVCLALFVVITPVTCGPRDHRTRARIMYDLSNIRQAVIAINAYAAENIAQYPTHIKDAEDYWGVEDIFYSPFDHKDAVVFDETIATGWYAYGSYWFLSAEGLTLDDVEQPDKFILVYRAPRLDHDAYVVGYLDGHAEVLDSEAFAEWMKQQEEEMIQQQRDESSEHEASESALNHLPLVVRADASCSDQTRRFIVGPGKIIATTSQGGHDATSRSSTDALPEANRWRGG